MKTNPSLRTGLAAVLASGVAAGTMDSNNGNAIVAPTPRRNVRRGMNFLVMIIMILHFKWTLVVAVNLASMFELHNVPRTLFDAASRRLLSPQLELAESPPEHSRPGQSDTS